MDNTSTIKYQSSPYLIIEPDGGSGQVYKVYNSLTGRAFKVRQEVIEILDFLEEAKTFGQIRAAFAEHGEEDLKNMIRFFISRTVIFSEDAIEEQLTQVTRLKKTLFGFNDQMSQQGRNLCFIGIPFGGGNHESVGCAHFPEEIRAYTEKYQLQLSPFEVDDFSLEAIGIASDQTDLPSIFQKNLVKDLGNLFISIQETNAFIYRKIESIAFDLFNESNIPFFLGGDHSITYPIIKAASRVYKNLYLVQLDAHTDTYRSKYDGFKHAGKVHHHGNFASKCLELDGVKGIYQMGIRGIFNMMSRRKDPKQRIYWCSELKRNLSQGAWPEVLPEDAEIYITVDIDALDPTVAPATATPVANGLQLNELMALLEFLTSDRRIIGLDLVEVNPGMDQNDLTMQTSVELILRLLSLFRLNDMVEKVEPAEESVNHLS
jgi:agmatinase